MATAIRQLPDTRWSLARYIIILAMAIFRTSALSQQYCASLNTGSGSSAVSNNFQSNGACSKICSGYAFAIVQGKNCWCSNYAPGATTSTGDCSIACPGYPYENCGNEDSGLYGYVALGPPPSGTQGAAASSITPDETTTTQPTQSVAQSSAQVLPPTPSPVTVRETVIAPPSVLVSYVSITPSTTSTSTTPRMIPVSITLDTTTTTPTTTSTPSTPQITESAPIQLATPTTADTTSTTPMTTWTPIPFTSVITVTGEAQTLTITPTAPPAATTYITVPQKDSNNGGFFSNAGKVAGTFVVVGLLLVALIAGAIWFFLRRKRQAEATSTGQVTNTAGGGTPQRRPSRLSQMGLLGGTGAEKTVPRIQTGGLEPGNSAEKSPADTLTGNRENSFPPVVDQRLEPTALWNPLHSNGSHVSVRSFRDDQDYSRRMLRVANPDDE